MKLMFKFFQNFPCFAIGFLQRKTELCFCKISFFIFEQTVSIEIGKQATFGVYIRGAGAKCEAAAMLAYLFMSLNPSLVNSEST